MARPIGGLLLGLVALFGSGCIEYLESGELGQFRYLGDYVAEETFLFKIAGHRITATRIMDKVRFNN